MSIKTSVINDSKYKNLDDSEHLFFCDDSNSDVEIHTVRLYGIKKNPKEVLFTKKKGVKNDFITLFNAIVSETFTKLMVKTQEFRRL